MRHGPDSGADEIQEALRGGRERASAPDEDFKVAADLGLKSQVQRIGRIF